jgi:putative hemolysin
MPGCVALRGKRHRAWICASLLAANRMNTRKKVSMKWILTLALTLLVLTACAAPQTQPTPAPVSTELPQADMPNPASVYCEQQGFQSEIRTTADGSQTGYCIFPDGSECDEWAYFRGECMPSGSTPQPTDEIVDGWRIYRNELLGYSFQYPAEAEIIIEDNPLKSLSISGAGMGNEFWNISHPSEREEYRPVAGADLFQWLTDQHLVGEKRLPDTQIAGTLAIHFRHERSPQAYADDRYYFAKAGQLYMVLIGHSSDVEDWELNNRFLQSIQFNKATSSASVPTPISTPLPIDPADYQGWWTFTHPVYNFSIRLPEDWVVDETTTFDTRMNGHALNLHPTYNDKERIRMTFRRAGEDMPLWPTGVGSGQFITHGTLDVAGQPARRILFVCPTGEITAIWYHDAVKDQPNLARGELEFGFIYSYYYCEPGFSLGGKIQRVGEMIIASLKVP